MEKWKLNGMFKQIREARVAICNDKFGLSLKETRAAALRGELKHKKARKKRTQSKSHDRGKHKRTRKLRSKSQSKSKSRTPKRRRRTRRKVRRPEPEPSEDESLSDVAASPIADAAAHAFVSQSSLEGVSTFSSAFESTVGLKSVCSACRGGRPSARAEPAVGARSDYAGAAYEYWAAATAAGHGHAWVQAAGGTHADPALRTRTAWRRPRLDESYDSYSLLFSSVGALADGLGQRDETGHVSLLNR